MCTTLETLRARYAELLRLREYVEQLEHSLQDTAKRQVVERSELRKGETAPMPTVE